MAAQSDMSSIWNVRVVSINGLKLINKWQKQAYQQKHKRETLFLLLACLQGVYLVRIEFLILSLEAQFFVREWHLQLMSLTTSICKGKIRNLSTAGRRLFRYSGLKSQRIFKYRKSTIISPGSIFISSTFEWRGWTERGGHIWAVYACPHRKLPTYPSPNPKFCPKWEVSVNVGLGYC